RTSSSPHTSSTSSTPAGMAMPDQRRARSPPSFARRLSLPYSATHIAAQTPMDMTGTRRISTQASAVTDREEAPAGSSTGGGQPSSASARLELEEVGGDIAGFLVGHGDGRHGGAGHVGGCVAHELHQHAGLVGQAAGDQALAAEVVQSRPQGTAWPL